MTHHRVEELNRLPRRIKILGAGGTIAMAPNEVGTLRPALSIDEIVSQVPTLRDMAAIKLEQLVSKDSTNINPHHWKRIARRIEDAQNAGYHGVLVTHGTDTMPYTAGAVALAMGRGLKIPVVFTGAQLPFTSPGTDARFNLENAMRTILEAEKLDIAEVMITFSDKVLRGVRAIKTSEAKFDAFDSPALPPLAKITATGINFQDFALTKNSSEQLKVRPEFTRFIFAVDVVPGLDPKILMNIISLSNCKGIVLKSLGSGNVPSEGAYSLLPVIKEAVKRNIPVLVATKFVGGHTRMEMYEPGKKALDFGAIPTGDMTDVMAQVKLMWLLTNRDRWTSKLTLRELSQQINSDHIGEITPEKNL